MIKYLVFILVVLFSQIKGGEIIHTETYKDGSISSIKYFKKGKVEGVSVIFLIKKEEYHRSGILKKENNYSKRIPYEELVSSTDWYNNGQKEGEGTWKDGKLISSKMWNKDGSVKE